MTKKLLSFALCLTLPLLAADNAAAPNPSAGASEIEQLKALLADQQRQINELRRALNAQNPDQNKPTGTTYRGVGEVASTTPIVPPAPAPAPVFAPPPVAPPPAPQEGEKSSPLQFKIGDAYITPVGFMDFTTITRSTNPGSGLGTNFGSIPFSNTPQGNLSETRFSAQNSRLGLRVDALVHGAKVLGYMEGDFLGFVPPNAAVSSNSDTFRLRLYWVDVQKGKFEFLAGQSWSLLTPNRRGLSALPGDLFYTQNIDVNYQNGLVWSRDQGFRMIFHPSPKAAFGISLENPEQYVGGSAGGGAITLPTALSALAGTQLNNGNSTLATPGLHPDIIAKLALDPSKKFHIELAGVERTFKVYNPNTQQKFSTAAGAGSLNLNFELVKNVRLFTNNYYGSGSGRYMFGQVPDLILRADGSISPIHSGSSVTGIELQGKKTLYYAYYGGIYIQKNIALDTNGKPVGYGFSGSPNGQNRAIQEATFGINQTFWKDPKYGALNLMLQYSYLTRNPWFVATGQPSDAHTNMVFVNLRYSLPGTAPALEK